MQLWKPGVGTATVRIGPLSPDAPGAGLLWTVNADGSGAALAAAVWRVVAPRLALQAAELRQVGSTPWYIACLVVDFVANQWQTMLNMLLLPKDAVVPKGDDPSHALVLQKYSNS